MESWESIQKTLDYIEENLSEKWKSVLWQR